MFDRSQRFYDRIYTWKDYAADAARLRALIQARRAVTRSLLDVACGTARHLEYFSHWVPHLEGVDIDPMMVDIARQRLPNVRFHRADMTRFDLRRKFDVVTCLFSSIGYVRSIEGLRDAIGCMARHVEDDGVLLLEPWLRLEDHQPGHVGLLTVNEPDLKVVRMNVARLEGREWHMDMHYLVGTPNGIESFVEPHILASFTDDEVQMAFEAAGLVGEWDSESAGRGLWIGTKHDAVSPGLDRKAP